VGRATKARADDATDTVWQACIRPWNVRAREAQHLHDEERIAFRHGIEGIRVLVGLRRGPAGHLVASEAGEREVEAFTSDLGQRLARLRREACLDVAVGDDDDDARGVQAARDEVEQGE